MSKQTAKILQLLDQKAALRHRKNCSYGNWPGDTGDACTCDLWDRKAVFDREIAEVMK